MEKNIFGTDGIRAKIGTEPFTVTGLERIADALGFWVCKTFGFGAHILLGHDTRLSAGFVKSVLKSRLLLYPVTLFDAQVLTTPAVFKIMQDTKQFDVGIIISASHNPFDDNGIKVIDRRYGKIMQEDEVMISSYAQGVHRHYDYSALGVERIFTDAHILYHEQMLSYFKPALLRGKKVVLDCAHGAAFAIAPALFNALGAQTIVIHNKPNGVNINHKCGALHTDLLQAAVLEYNADIGFAFDGDADRIIAVNRRGCVKDGDDILALLLTHPTYAEIDTVVGTVMTNKGFEQHLKNCAKKLCRTPVGDKYIAAQMQQNNWVLGGEPSGHIIVGNYMPTGDGIFVALKIMETLCITNNWDMETFVKFPQIIINVPVAKKRDLKLVPASDIIAYHETMLHAGRLLVRYSGTEPLLRIMVEDDDYEHAKTIGIMLSEKLQHVLL